MPERTLIAVTVVLVLIAAGAVVRWIVATAGRSVEGQTVSNQPPKGASEILLFYGPRCRACDEQKRVLAAGLAESSDKFQLRLVDAVTDAELSRSLGVVVVPTTVVTDDQGVVLCRHSRLVTWDELMASAAA
jgi:hypothetical protein